MHNTCNCFVIRRMNRRRECFRNLVKCGAMNIDKWGTPAFVRYIKELKIPIDRDGNYSMQSMRVKNVQAPLDDYDAANKEYVDSILEEAKKNTDAAISSAIEFHNEGNKAILERLSQTINEMKEKVNSVVLRKYELQEDIRRLKETINILMNQIEHIYTTILTIVSNTRRSSEKS